MEKTLSHYAGQCIALVEERIIAAAPTSVEAYKKAKLLYPGKLITLMRVPRKREVVTFL